MITATNKSTREEKTFTDEVWDMLERGGHDKNWTNIVRSENKVGNPAPPIEVADAVKAELRNRKPFGDNPPADA